MATPRLPLVAVLSVALAGCPSSPGQLPVPDIGSPRDVAVTPGDREIVVTWSPVAGAASYDVHVLETATAVGAPASVQRTFPGATSPFHVPATNWATYEVFVAASDGHVEGPPSEVVSVVVAQRGPVVAVSAGDGAIAIAWEPIAGAGSYVIMVVDSDGAVVAANTHGGEIRADVVTGLANGRPHRIGAQAFVGGEWTAVTEATATPAAGAIACLALAPTRVTDALVELAGVVVNPPGRTTSPSFELGSSGAYGSSVPLASTAMTGATWLSATAPGLPSGADLHFRVVARSAEVACASPDRVARTLRTPQVVASSLAGPMAIVLAPELVFWAERDANRIARAWKAGPGGAGAATTVAPATAPTALASDGVSLYVADGDGIRRIDPVGGASSQVSAGYSGLGGDRSLVSDGGSLYWSRTAAGVWSVPAAGGSPVEVVPDAGSFAVANGTIYWSSSSGIWRDALDGSGPVLLGDPPYDVSALLLSDEWLAYGMTVGGALCRLRTSGGASEFLGQIAGTPLAADATHVYWADVTPLASGGSEGRLRKMPIAGGPVTTLAYLGQAHPWTYPSLAPAYAGTVAVDETHVYWLWNPLPPNGGAIFRTPKD